MAPDFSSFGFLEEVWASIRLKSFENEMETFIKTSNS